MKKTKLTSGKAATTAGEYEDGGSATLPRKGRSKRKTEAHVPAEPASKSEIVRRRASMPAPGTSAGKPGLNSLSAFVTPEKIARVFATGDEISEVEKGRETKRLAMCLASLVKNHEAVSLSNADLENILGTIISHVDSITEDNWTVVQQAIMLAMTPKNCGSCFNSLESLINEVLVHRPHYAGPIAQQLISKLVRPYAGPTSTSVTNIDGPSIAELKSFNVATKLTCKLVEVIGVKRLSRTLAKTMGSCYPYVLKPTLTHFYYVRNLLNVNKASNNSLTHCVLSVLFHKLTQLDALIPRDVLDSERLQDVTFPKRERSTNDNTNSFIIPDDEAEDLVLEIINSYAKVADEVEQVQQIATLDICLSYLISFLSTVEETLNFHSLLSIFETEVLPVFNTNCIQFAFFYLINKKEEYLHAFLEFLWKKFINVSTSAVLRIQAIGYMAGVLARSIHVDRRTLKRWISRLSAFANEYLNSKCLTATHWSNVNIHLHGPFYAVCQAIFYTFAFRHFELVYGNMPFFKEESESKERRSKPNIQTLPPPSSNSFIYSLDLQRLITCDLNPLKACSPPVAKKFVDAAHAYQISYCKTVLERNNRASIKNMVFDTMREVSSVEGDGVNILTDSFFPFDPLPLVYAKMLVDEDFRAFDDNSLALTLVEEALGSSQTTRRNRRDSRGNHNEEDDNCDDLDLSVKDEVDGEDILLASCE